jgi:Fe-S cluster assembly protein SufD
MTVATTDSAQQFIEAYEAAERDFAGPSWLAPLRKAAIARFGELGLPTTRHEEWRFTNLSPLARATFAAAPAADVSLADIREFLVDERWPRLVCVNGRYDARLSLTKDLPAGVSLRGLAERLRENAPGLEGQLAQHADTRGQAFTALNTAMFSDGASLRVGRNVALETPILLLFVATAAAEPTVTHPRVLLVGEQSANFTVIERYVSLGASTYFTNAVTEIVAGPNAVIDHYKSQRESEQAFHIAAQRLQLDRDSRVSSHSLSIGGRLVRNNVHAMLAGAGADANLNGLFVTRGDQHVDNHLRVEHVSPRCASWEFYKGILDGRSSGVFTGRIFVHKQAQKTDAKQSNDNLLLSTEAQIDTKPQLEIFADDVRCTHGATIGQVDHDAIFYLRSRGVPADAARSMLIYAFAGESLGQIKVEPLRDQFQKLLLERLPHGKMLAAGSPLFYGADFARHVKALDRRREST